jgi:hypothetical protein
MVHKGCGAIDRLMNWISKYGLDAVRIVYDNAGIIFVVLREWSSRIV